MEIGSEFWQVENCNIEKRVSGNSFCLLSGRTALDYIAKDSGIRSIMLPSYCCETMIEPFLRNGVNVSFYSIGVDGITYDDKNACEAVLTLDYFGYSLPKMVDIAKKEYAKGKIIIYDSTHKINGNKEIEKFSTYSLCSFRKWFYCNCAIVTKHKGGFAVAPPVETNYLYEKLRNEAAEKKSEYINGGNVQKSEYLALFAEANNILDRDYVGYAGTEYFADIETIIYKRRENATVLINHLSKIDGIRLMKPYLDNGDAPLFVPILLKNEAARNELRKHLIDKDIYCPIHWPLSKLHQISNYHREIYTRELSIICDQRYNMVDMEREATEIKNYFEKRT